MTLKKGRVDLKNKVFFGTKKCVMSESKSLVNRLNHKLGICEEKTGELEDKSRRCPPKER